MTRNQPWNPTVDEIAFVVKRSDDAMMRDEVRKILSIEECRIVEVHDDRMYLVDANGDFRQVRLPYPEHRRASHYTLTTKGREGSRQYADIGSFEIVCPEGEDLAWHRLRFATQELFATLEDRTKDIADEVKTRRRYNCDDTWDDYEALISRLETTAREAREAFDKAKESRS